MKIILIILLLISTIYAEDSSSLFYKGRSLYFKSNYEESIKIFEKAYNIKPEDSEIKKYYIKNILKLAEIYSKRKDYDKAVEQYKKGILIDETNIYFYIGYIEILIERKDYTRAEAYCLKSINLKSNKRMKAHIKELLGWSYYNLNQYENAIKYIELAKKEMYDVDKYYNDIKELKLELKSKNKTIGLTKFDEKNYEESLKYFQKAKRYSEKEDNEIARKIIAINNFLGEEDRKKRMKKSIKKGDSLFKKKKYEKAISEYIIAQSLGAVENKINKKINKCKAKIKEIQDNIRNKENKRMEELEKEKLKQGAKRCFKERKWKDSLSFLKRFLKYDKNDIEMLELSRKLKNEYKKLKVFKAAEKEFLLRNYKDALKYYLNALEFSNNKKYELEKIIICCKKTKKTDDAIKYLKYIIELYPDKVEYYIDIADIYYNSNILEKSIESYKKAILKGYIPDFEIYVRIGKMYEKKGDIDSALEYLNKARDNVNIDKAKEIYFYYDLANLYYYKGNYKKAALIYKKSMKISNNMGKPFKMYIWVLFKIWGFKIFFVILNLIAVFSYIKWYFIK